MTPWPWGAHAIPVSTWCYTCGLHRVEGMHGECPVCMDDTRRASDT